MPKPAKPMWSGWYRRRKAAAVGAQSSAGGAGASPDPVDEEAAEPRNVQRFTAAQRRSLFAHLAWFTDYTPCLDVEAAGEGASVAQLEEQYTSTYMRRQLRRESAGAQRSSEGHRSRMREAASHLARAKNVLHVPFSQAMKGIFFLCALVSRPVWTAERKARRVVSQNYAVEVLRTMSECRPQPIFECAAPSLIASIAFDQTYLKAAGTTGISAYSAVQTVDAQGNAVHRERMTYINGQHFPVPLAAVPLDAADVNLISRVGPYTQDFARVLPLLDPQRLDGVMDGFLQRAVGLLHGQAPTSALDAILSLLSRPNADPGGPTHLTYMHPPLFDTDTKSYTDMIKIVEWCEQVVGSAHALKPACAVCAAVCAVSCALTLTAVRGARGS
jgi:hypothetical protein